VPSSITDNDWRDIAPTERRSVARVYRESVKMAAIIVTSSDRWWFVVPMHDTIPQTGPGVKP